MARGELLDGGLVVAQLGENLGGVLAEKRRHARDAGSLAVPPNRQADGAIVGYPWMLRGDEHAAGHRLRLGGDLVEGEDGSARHDRPLETIEHIRARERARDGRERLEDFPA